MKKDVKAGRQTDVKSGSDDKETKRREMHLFARVPKEVSVKKRIEAWSLKIEKQELKIDNKDKNKEVALGTSKLNYNDPRITVEWCKLNEMPIEKVFAANVRDKFPWAMESNKKFKW